MSIKLKVIEFAPKFAEKVKDKVPEGSNVFLVAATLRPETMYGQTCCFVSPDAVSYGLFQGGEKEFYVMTERAAKNAAFRRCFSRLDV